MKAFDLRPKRDEMEVTQEDVTGELGLNSGTLTDIEKGRIGIDDETYDNIRAAIKRASARKLGRSSLQKRDRKEAIV